MLVPGRYLALPGQAKRLVRDELVAQRVGCGANGDTVAVSGGKGRSRSLNVPQDNTERDQLWGNLLELSETLCDGVCCRIISASSTF